MIHFDSGSLTWQVSAGWLLEAQLGHWVRGLSCSPWGLYTLVGFQEQAAQKDQVEMHSILW
jgi:hypothetical protein